VLRNPPAAATLGDIEQTLVVGLQATGKLERFPIAAYGYIRCACTDSGPNKAAGPIPNAL
jgi:hypothetical protein